MFDAMAKDIHETAVEKGFWNHDIDDIFIAKQCMMIVSEVTELMEAVRKNRGSEETVKEFADIIIRTLDLYEGMLEEGYVAHSLDDIMEQKTAFNKTRPQLHGVRF